ncbi:MAG: GAF domain-containing protein [Prosthecobacter sp.]
MIAASPALLSATAAPPRPVEDRRSFLLDLSDALHPLEEPARIQAEACRVLGRRLHAARVLYVESDGNGASMPGPQYTDGVPAMHGPLPLVSFDSTLPEKYRLGRPILQPDVANDASLTAEQKANFASHQIGSYIAVPMVKSGGIVARLGVHHRAAHAWTDEEIILVQETAERLWSALEHANAQTALRRSEERLRALVTASANVIYRMNADWSRMLTLEGQGFPADTKDARMEWMQGYIDPADQPQVIAAIQKAIETKSTFELEHRVRRADGSFGWTHSRAVPLLDETGNITEWFGSASDVTERVRAEEAVAAELRGAELLRDLGARFVSDEAGIQALYDEINGIARQLTHSQAGTVQILDAETQELILRSVHGFPADASDRFGRVDAASATSCGEALQANRRIFLDFDEPALADPKGDLRMHVDAGYLSAQSTPLIARSGRAIGMVSTHWHAHHRPSERELRFLDLLARQAADLIEQWQAREELRQSEARLAAELQDTRQLQKISSQFLQEHDMQGIYGQIVDAARGLMKADAASIQMLQPDTHELLMLAGLGVDAEGGEFWRYVTTRSSSSCGESLRTGRRCIIPDVEKWDFAAGSQDLQHFRRNGLRALQSTPLISRTGQMVGMISTHWKEPQTPSEHELRLLDVLARQAADLIERQAAGDKLRASEERYRSLFDSIDEGFCLIEVLFDKEGRPNDYRFIEANPAFEKHTGLKDVLGRTMRELAPDHDAHWYEVYGRIVHTGHPERFELPAEPLGRFYDVYAFRVGEESQHRVAVLFDDITGRKLTEDILRQEADLDAFRVALGDALRSLTDPAEVQAAAARVLGVHLQASRAVYGEVEHQPDSDYYILRHDYHAPDVPSHAGRYRANDFGATLFEAMRAGRTLVVSDVATEPKLSEAERQAHAAAEVAAYICVPLLKEGRHMAFICVDHKEPRLWTQSEIAVVEETAERAWAAVESARYEQTLRQSEEKQAFLLALTDALRPLGKPEEIMEQAVRMLGRQLHVTQAGYAETDNGDSYLDILADWTVEGRPSVVGQHPLLSHDGEDIRSYQAGRPWIVEDAETDARQVVRDVAHVYVEAGARATLNVPMVKDGRWVAMLYATSATARRWTPGEIELAREVAERTWAALELARAQQAMREAKEAAELASRSKDHFLAVLSHELRTPLTPVLMTVDSLQHDTSLSPALREDLAMMKRNIQLETKLIDDLLDISRITSGKLVLPLAAVDVNDVVRNVCRLCNPLVRERGIELHTRLARSAGVINADSARVQQVLWNVLMNALKFTPAGGSITVTTEWLDSSRCEVRIQDTGAGIAPEVLPHIFNAFEQGGAGVTRQFGGLGLGLAICKALVELHHGSIRAESAGAGQGAAFIIELPGRAMTATAKIRLAAPAAKVDSSHLRLLLVEDHPDTERVLGALLRRAGFTVVTAQNVTKAVATAREQSFDLLVSDLGLPDGTGYDVMRNVHSILGIPGVAMSGYGMEEDIRRSREAGFSEHLVKPIDVPELISTIRRVASKHVGAVG